MEFIIARPEHLEDMCRITDQAKASLKALGLDQWQKGYPNREVWTDDIEKGITWLAVEEGTVLGAFAFQTEPDESYGVIDGAWLTENAPYASMHRVCVADEARGRGVAGAMFRHGFALARALELGSMRIDTHPGNKPMQSALTKAGFIPCGGITIASGVEAGDGRVAYEIIL